MLCVLYFDADQGLIGKIAHFDLKSMVFSAPMGLIWVEKGAVVLIFSLKVSISHDRCDKNPLATR